MDKVKSWKETIKNVLLVIRIIIVTFVSIGLFATYRALENTTTFFLTLITIHLFIFVISYMLNEKVFKKAKKKGVVKNYLGMTWKVAIIGAIAHATSFMVGATNQNFVSTIYYNYILVLGGIIFSAVLLQRISFFKIV